MTTRQELEPALRRLADAIRQTYAEAGFVHVALGDPTAGITVTEVYDAEGFRLDDEESAQDDDWQHVAAELDLAAREGHDVACAVSQWCDRRIALPPRTPSALETWRRTVERVLDVDQDEVGAWLYDVTSAERHHNPIAAGVVHLAVGANPDTAAEILRDAFARITGDASVGVTVVSRQDDGGSDWSGRGVAEPPEQ